jgi:predicted metalloprotease
MSANNAAYCPQRNTIYFDEVFVARQTKAAAHSLGSDGDMAGIGIIAHEMGHAVAMQLGEASYIPYENEAAADCLAGAFTQQAAKDGTLEKGDLERGVLRIRRAGDPTPEIHGNRRIDRQISMRAAMLGHGTRDQRLANSRLAMTAVREPVSSVPLIVHHALNEERPTNRFVGLSLSLHLFGERKREGLLNKLPHLL